MTSKSDARTEAIAKAAATYVLAKSAYAAANTAWLAVSLNDMIVVGELLRGARRDLHAADIAYAASRATR